MNRILIIGTSGSGKSTLARKLSERLQIPCFASDHFYWEADWKTASNEKVRRQVMDVIRKAAWILDGNFDEESDLVWKCADCILWLDYPLFTIGRQIIVRNIWWFVTQEPTWSGNRMTLQRAISGIRHAIKSHPIKRNKYPQRLVELSNIEIHRFCSPRETDAWLHSLKTQNSAKSFAPHPPDS